MRTLAFALLVMVAAAGCSGKGSGTGPASPSTGVTENPSPPHGMASGSAQPPPPSPSTPLSIALGGCTNFGGVFPVPMDAAQAVLPDGFKPVAAAGDPQGGATLYVLALRCTEATVDGAEVGKALLGYEELAVTPDAAHAVKGVSDYTVPLLFTAAPQALGDALAKLRLGRAGPGGLVWDSTGAGTLHAEASLDGAGFILAGQVAPAAPTGLASGGFVLFGVQDRQVVSVVNGTSAGGQGYTAAVTLQAQGDAPLLGEARPAARGFSVQDFALVYTEAR